jgi:hypothetical protein
MMKLHSVQQLLTTYFPSVLSQIITGYALPLSIRDFGLDFSSGPLLLIINYRVSTPFLLTPTLTSVFLSDYGKQEQHGFLQANQMKFTQTDSFVLLVVETIIEGNCLESLHELPLDYHRLCTECNHYFARQKCKMCSQCIGNMDRAEIDLERLTDDKAQIKKIRTAREAQLDLRVKENWTWSVKDWEVREWIPQPDRESYLYDFELLEFVVSTSFCKEFAK